MATGLYIALDFKPRLGGIAEHTHQMAKHLTELGEQITVLTPSQPGDAEFDKTCDYPVIRFDTKLPVGNWLKSRLDRRLMLIGILRIARRIKANYLICDRWSPIAGVNLILASKLTQIPFFLFAHGTELARPTRLGIFRGMALRMATRVLCVSGYTKSLAENIGVKQASLAVIHNGFDSREIESYRKRRKENTFPRLDAVFPPGAQTVVTISRLVPRKGIDRVIEAMPRIVSALPGTRYVIGGDGEDRDRLERLANASPARESIVFLGRLTEYEKFECYNRCDVFAMPNRESADGDVEGFGIVFLEANAFGKPVVGGHSGGAIDAIVHEKTGLLVDPLDADSIAESLMKLLKNPQYAHKIGDNGKQMVENEFTWKTGANRLLSITQSSINV